MHSSHVIGFQRIGPSRELKFSLERYWNTNNKETENLVMTTRRNICTENWKLQQLSGLDFLTVGDFAFYDNVLSTLMMIGGLPKRFSKENNPLKRYSSAARGTGNIKAMEMKKWFNTNYHYLVPEYYPNMNFSYEAEWLMEEIELAQSFNQPLKVNILGPVTLLWLGKEYNGLINRLELLSDVLEVYKKILLELEAKGISCIQMEEPVACLEVPAVWSDALKVAYDYLTKYSQKILLTTYFTFTETAAALLFKLPVAGVHIDTTNNFSLDSLEGFPKGSILSVGIVDGRNVWKNDVGAAVTKLQKIKAMLHSTNSVWISTGCSLLHVPQDISLEDGVEPTIKNLMAFGVQKIKEVVKIKKALDGASSDCCVGELSRRFNPAVGFSTEELVNFPYLRANYPFRSKLQRVTLGLPALTITTIGSFPQTSSIRTLRSRFRTGAIGRSEYVFAIKREIGFVIRKQLRYGVDVLAHGEVERNDMVEFFGEQLKGFVITKAGWVQSYGSRCTKPPVIVTDVSFLSPMTVFWFRKAQDLTSKPVKGMITGPTTILNWSFIRRDLSYQEVSLQVTSALRKELTQLEAYGAKVVQIDEPAIREGLPFNKKDSIKYLDWVVRVFRTLASSLSNEVQVHTHMCYSEFGDIMEAIVGLDADVISVEAARSNMILLESFKCSNYSKGLGLGIYDIHSPDSPGLEEMVTKVKHMISVFSKDLVWINPDCGLKTRTWSQVDVALNNLVEAVKICRKDLKEEQH